MKQTGCAWNKRLDKELHTLGAKLINGDPCVYVRRRKGILIIIIYDDMLVMCRDLKKINRFGRDLANLFEIMDLGDLKHCLGMNFSRNDVGILVNQKTYIKDVFQRFEMSDCNAVSTPLNAGTKLVKDESWSTRFIGTQQKEHFGTSKAPMTRESSTVTGTAL